MINIQRTNPAVNSSRYQQVLSNQHLSNFLAESVDQPVICSLTAINDRPQLTANNNQRKSCWQLVNGRSEDHV